MYPVHSVEEISSRFVREFFDGNGAYPTAASKVLAFGAMKMPSLIMPGTLEQPNEKHPCLLAIENKKKKCAPAKPVEQPINLDHDTSSPDIPAVVAEEHCMVPVQSAKKPNYFSPPPKEAAVRGPVYTRTLIQPEPLLNKTIVPEVSFQAPVDNKKPYATKSASKPLSSLKNSQPTTSANDLEVRTDLSIFDDNYGKPVKVKTNNKNDTNTAAPVQLERAQPLQRQMSAERENLFGLPVSFELRVRDGMLEIPEALFSSFTSATFVIKEGEGSQNHELDPKTIKRVILRRPPN